MFLFVWSFTFIDIHYFGVGFVLWLKVSIVASALCAELLGADPVVFVLDNWHGLLLGFTPAYDHFVAGFNFATPF